MKAKMPEPEAYLYVNGEHRGVSLHFRSDLDMAEGTVRQALISTTQAEAYAEARVRVALEEAAKICENTPNPDASAGQPAYAFFHADVIRALISKKQS